MVLSLLLFYPEENVEQLGSNGIYRRVNSELNTDEIQKGNCESKYWVNALARFCLVVYTSGLKYKIVIQLMHNNNI